MRSSFTSRAISVGLCVLLASPNVWADPEIAAKYYQQASEAYSAGRLKEAADLLERAFAEEPDLVYQYNRILAFEGLKEFETALRIIDIYKDPMLRDADKRFEDIEKIQQRIRDGLEVQRLSAEKDTKDPDPIEKPVEPPPAESKTNWLAISLIGGGAVGLGLGGLFASGMLVSDELDSTKCVNDNLAAGAAGEAIFQNCTSYAQYLTYNAKAAAYDDDKGSIETQQLMSIIFFSAGAILATSGVLVWALSDSEKTQSSASLAPVLHPNGAGATLNVRF